MDGDEGGVDIEEFGDEDIYGDLESDIFVAPVKRRRLDEVLQHEEYQNLSRENQALKRQIKQLQKENKVYCSNISALYLTAKSEIEKKNFIIKNLTEKLKKITKSKSSLSNKEVEEILVRCQEAFLESQAQVTLNEITKSFKVSPTSSGKRKHIKFGNMSLYFFREQGCFSREEIVTFPKPVVEDQDKQASHRYTDQFPLVEEQDKEMPDTTYENDRHSSDHDFNVRKSHQNSSNSTNVNLVQSATSPPSHPTCEADHKRRKSGDRVESSRTEHNRDTSNRRSGGERHNDRNSHSHSRSRNHTPPPGDRHHRKSDRDRDDVRYNYTRGKDYDGRKSENFRRHHRDSWQNYDNRTRSAKRFNNDTKYSNSNSAHRKYSRSRSKSK